MVHVVSMIRQMLLICTELSLNELPFLHRFTNSMVYYGVLLSVGVLGGSLYLNFFLTSLIDIPSNFFVIWFMNW